MKFKLFLALVIGEERIQNQALNPKPWLLGKRGFSAADNPQTGNGVGAADAQLIRV